jgi:hypothetical protein
MPEVSVTLTDREIQSKVFAVVIRFRMDRPALLKWGSACYHSILNIFSFALLFKDINNTVCRATILPVVLYGCETSSRTLKKDCRRTFFEGRVLWMIVGPEKVDVTQDWRKLHCEELHDFRPTSYYPSVGLRPLACLLG